MRILLCGLALTLATASLAETLTGFITGRAKDDKSFTLKVNGKTRNIGLTPSTKYCGMDGTEQPMLGGKQFGWWNDPNSTMKVTVETTGSGNAEVASKLTFPVKIQMGGDNMKLPPGAKVQMLSSTGKPGAGAIGLGTPPKGKGKPVPAFSLTSIDGNSLSSDRLKGKVYLLDFWATWCKPCTMLSTELSKIHDELASKGFQVIGVNARETGDALKAVKAFMKDHRASYPVTAGSDKFADQLGVSALPSLFLIDQQGKIAETYVGYSSDMGARIRKRVQELLKK